MYYNAFIFPVVIFSIILIIIAVNVNSLRQFSVPGTFSYIFNSVGILFSYLSISVIVFVEIVTSVNNIKLLNYQVKGWYIIIFLAKTVVFSFILSLGIWINYSYLSYAIIIIIVCYLTLVLIGRPYKDIFSTLSLALN